MPRPGAACPQDFQESWELMFDAVDTTYDCVRIATGVLSTLRINPDRMLAGLSADMLATDLAEYLVRKGEEPAWRLCRTGVHLSWRLPTSNKLDQQQPSFIFCGILLSTNNIPTKK